MIAVERDTTQSQRHCFIGSKSLCYGPDNSVRPTSGDRDAVKGIYYECRVGLGNKAQQVVRLGLRQAVTCWWLGLTVVLAGRGGGSGGNNTEDPGCRGVGGLAVGWPGSWKLVDH